MASDDVSRARSSRDALAGAGLGCAVAIVGGGLPAAFWLLAAAWEIGNPEILGSATARAGVLSLLLAAVSGIAWALRARRVAGVAAVVAVALTVAPIVASVLGPERFPYPPPSAEERAAPVLVERDGVRTWLQPAVGLELRTPPELRLLPASAMPAPTGTSPDDGSAALPVWSWTNDARDRALLVQVLLTMRYDDPADDARYADGLQSGWLSGMGAAGFVVLSSERRSRGETVVRARHETLGGAFMRSIVYRHGDVLVAVTATALGPQHATLTQAVESVRGRPEHTTPL